MDVVTLALAKKYTKDTSNGLGAVKGSPCTISQIDDVDAGKQVTFSWTGTDGAVQTQSMIVPKGEAGESPTIESEETDEGTKLIITDSEGTKEILIKGGSSATYTDSTGAGVTLGGFSAGETSSNLSFQDAFYKLLHPYTKPVVTIGIAPTTTIYEAGSSISSLKITANVTKKSKDIVNVKFYLDGILLSTITDDVANGGKFSYTYTTTITGTNGNSHVVKVTTTDGTNEVSAQTVIYFIGKSYYGSLDNSSAVNESNILALSSALKNSKSATYTFTTEFGRFVYAYPTSLGDLSSIKDNVNNLNYTDSVTKTTMTINDISYNVYYLTDSAGFDNVKITFA